MKATIVEMRYRMRDVLKALERNEDVGILYHGKLKGILRSAHCHGGRRVADHPLFGLRRGQESMESVEEEMETLRGVRHPAL